jgi:hypothetical protein
MRLFLILLTLVSLEPAPAAAQRFVRAREPAAGELAAGDSALASGALYDTWYFRAEPGHAYAIYLLTDVEAQLAVAPGVGPACEGDCARGKTAATAGSPRHCSSSPSARASTRSGPGAARAGQMGEYELLLEEGELPGLDADTIQTEPHTPAELGDAAAAWAARPQDLYSGTPATGTLGTSRRNAHGEHYDEWSYYAPAGETVTLTLDLDEFDTVLRIVGKGMEGDEELAWDDDAGGGTNSTLTFTHPRSGVYRVQAAGKGGATGRYTILASSHGNVETDVMPVFEEDPAPAPPRP